MIAGLPYDAEVEYLESTGTQWIDTGVKFSSADDINISFSATDSDYYAAIFGAGNADGDAGASYSVYLQNRAQVVFQCTAARGAAFNYSSGTRYNVSCAVSNGAMSVDGSPCGTNGTPFVSCDYNVYLFARNVAGSVDRRGKFRVYSFSIAGKVDFIPVRFTNSNGQSEGAMYDRVSRKLFRNAGTGAFTIGPDVATPVMGLHFMPKPPPYDAKVEYLESTGTQWIELPLRFADFPNSVLSFSFGLAQSYSVNLPFFGSFASSSGGYNRCIAGSSRLNWSVGGAADFMLQLGTVDEAKNGMVSVFCDVPNNIATCLTYTGTPLTNWNEKVREAIKGNQNPFQLFKTNNTNPVIGFRIGAMSCLLSGTMLFDIIPVRFTNELGQSEGAMYDNVSKQLFRNQGTGAFLWAEKQ